MSFELLVGPPGSGKTSALMERAVELANRGERVWWAGLPGQRAEVYRRATREGALLGLEFQTLQQVYYRLLAHARRLKPLLKGTGRLALVGEALAQDREALPSPGEARLFASAVAEAKRYGVAPEDLPRGEPEVERFRTIYLRYERLKGEAWDYDDFRIEALRLAENGASAIEAKALFVDGFRELTPLDLRLLEALGEECEVQLALPQAPPGYEPSRALEARTGERPRVYQAANPVSEARWVLNALKRDLACGMDPLDLAVILPRGESVAFAALADEYGVPVMDERPSALADSRPGRSLLELLELPDYPTASRLLPIRELAPLASAALDRGVSGHAPLSRLAGELDLGERWGEWLERLRVPEDESPERIHSWAEDLVDMALAFSGDGGSGAGVQRGGLREGREGEIPPDRFRDQSLLRAREAMRVAGGRGLRPWWAALLADTDLPTTRPGGVALLDELQASGRRFRKAYLMHATEGTYGSGEREDYFVAEEERLPLARLLQGVGRGLPRRFEGRDRLLFAELLAVADELVVTFPGGDQGGPLLPEPALLGGARPQPLPPSATGSRLELAAGHSYRATVERSVDGTGEPTTPAERPHRRREPLTLEGLRLYDECAMRQWLEDLVGRAPGERPDGKDWWLTLRHDLLSQEKADDRRLDALAGGYPQAAHWLERHRNLLLDLSFGVRLPFEGREQEVEARLDAAVTREGEAFIYVFAAPGAVLGQQAAEEFVEERWTELWAAGHLLERYRGRIRKVRLLVWPLLGDPVEAFEGGIRSVWRRIGYRREWAQAALDRLAEGSIEPSPGFRCRNCRVRDVCREGAQ